MCRYLADLLAAPQPGFSVRLQQLESACGGKGVDIRLQQEIIERSRQKMRELGLDPNDTTGPELYHSLLALAAKHDQFLAQACGASSDSSSSEILTKIKSKIDDLNIPKQVWAIKSSVAKKLIQQLPPRKLMRQLGYKSVDSLLKRQEITDIITGARIVEGSVWLAQFQNSYRKLLPQDFENRQAKIRLLDSERYLDMAQKYVSRTRHNLISLNGLGTIMILPMPVNQLAGLTLSTLTNILNCLNQLRWFSSYLKFNQVQSDFGKLVSQNLINEPITEVTMANRQLPWRVIQRSFGDSRQASNSELFEPHVPAEDLAWRPAEETLFKIEPALLFWKDLDYVGSFKDNQIISLNLTDIAANYCNQLNFNQQVNAQMRQSLSDELECRYLAQEYIRQGVLEQLVNQNINPVEYQADPTDFDIDLESGWESKISYNSAYA